MQEILNETNIHGISCCAMFIFLRGNVAWGQSWQNIAVQLLSEKFFAHFSQFSLFPTTMGDCKIDTKKVSYQNIR